ncbi:hypothetical protein JB92DRAFT_3145219 [Gautieria morchelliformis]|nr:hypothetical protein JB92DRAFT_3145219 [Gautieria morchelliformis]
MRLQASDLGAVLGGTNIVSVLCHDLAYGTGGYAVQGALDRISCSSWGAGELKRLHRHGNVVLDAARRLLIDFDNYYSRGMAFRIFGALAAEHKTGELAQLLCGPHGIGSLVAKFAVLTQPTEHSYLDRYHTKCIRFVEGICTALLSACVCGFTQQVMEHGVCASLAALMEIFFERDRKMHWYFEEHESEDPDIERDQIAACKLMLKLVQHEEARSTMLECGAAEAVRRFDSSCIRLISDWDLRYLTRAIRRKLDGRNGESARNLSTMYSFF